MKKCIILSRVSTEKQTLEQQTELLVNKAISDGYTKNNIILIEDKESAIKLSSNEREGLKKLKKEIYNNDSIDCVYVYEISRIGRRMDVLIEMRDFLVENKIQLFIYNNNQYLLDEKKELTFAGGLIFTLFSQFAESEMKDKKDRMTRGKLHKRDNRKYIGGYIAYGYTKDEEDNIVIDPEKADIVRWIFNEYEKGQSLRSIGVELLKRGEITATNVETAMSFVGNTIKRESYTGIKPKKGYQYDAIISHEQWQRCNDELKTKAKFKSNIENIYYCQGLIKSSKSNRTLFPVVTANQYRFHSINDGELLTININFMDSFTWKVIEEHRSSHSEADRERDREEANRILDDAKKKLQNTDKRIKNIEDEKERFLTLFVKGRISEERYDEEIAARNHEIADIEIEKDEYTNIINKMNNRIIYTNFFLYESEQSEAKTDKEIYDIIHNEVKEIILHQIDAHNYIITYIFTDGITREYKYYSTQGKSIAMTMDDEVIDLVIKKRFQRKKYK